MDRKLVIQTELALGGYNADSTLANDEFNNSVIPIQAPIEISALQSFLFKNGLDSGLSALNRGGRAAGSPSADQLTAMTLFDYFDTKNTTIDMSLPISIAAVETLMDSLVGVAPSVPDQAAASTFKTTLKDMGKSFISKAQELGLGKTRVGEIIEARS